MEYDQYIIEIGSDQFKLIADHPLPARSKEDGDFLDFAAGELREGMEVLTADGPVCVTGVSSSRVSLQVWKIELEPPQAKCYLFGQYGRHLAVYGSPPRGKAVIRYRAIEVVPDADKCPCESIQSDPRDNRITLQVELNQLALPLLKELHDNQCPSVGSLLHPDCKGRCKSQPTCVKGSGCAFCHVLDCKNVQPRPNSRSRHRRQAEANVQPHN